VVLHLKKPSAIVLSSVCFEIRSRQTSACILEILVLEEAQCVIRRRSDKGEEGLYTRFPSIDSEEVMYMLNGRFDIRFL
jgi:hypothetical protein